MIWASAYVGIPSVDLGRDRNGCDCWGLARLVYADELGVDLPSYADDYVCAAEQAGIARLIDAAEACGPWRPVTVPGPFDLLLFRQGRYRSHVAVAVDARRMLHIAAQARSVIEDRTTGRWASRLVGAYRFEGRT